MISLGSLERRLSALERPYSFDIDFEGLEIQAFEALTDNELGLLEEFHSLRQSRFSTPEIESMMGDESYRAAIAGIEKADREYKRSINHQPDLRDMASRWSFPKSIAMMNVGSEYERMPKLEDIDREIQDIQKRMRRF